MNICFSLTNLERGGAQVFVLRLAEEMAKNKEHHVWIYDHWPEYRQLAVAPGSRVTLTSYNENAAGRWLIWKLNAVLKFAGIHPSFRHMLNRRSLQRFLISKNIDVLNSHAFYSDLVIASIQVPERCSFIPTLHGEYELFLDGVKTGDERENSLRKLLGQAGTIIYTAEKNLKPVERLVNGTVRKRRINTGIDPASMEVPPVTRSQAGVDEKQFVVGMVSRGIPEKGWEMAIRVIQSLNRTIAEPVRLLMVGEGRYLRKLAADTNDNNIVLAPQLRDQNAYCAYYKLFDLFLFPSTFKGESMPNAVIEAISQGVPVLATRHAELPYMLSEDSPHPCGITVNISPHMEEELKQRLTALINDRGLLNQLSANCRLAFPRFDLKKIGADYLDVFSGLNHQKT